MENINITRDIDNIIKQIKTPNFQKEIIDYLFVREKIDRVKIRTRRNDAQALLALDKFLRKHKINYKKLTRDDMLKCESFFEKLGLSTSSTLLYEQHIRRFYKYLFNKKEYKNGKRFHKNLVTPECVSWISTNQSNGTSLPIDKILDNEGLKRMLDVCTTSRDQAMVITFIDPGLRNSELISLNIENFGFDKLGAYLILPSRSGADLKTGQRKVRYFLVPSSVQYMKDYINKHPFKKYPKAPLFYSRDIHFLPGIIQKSNQEDLDDDDYEKLRLHRMSVKDIIKKIGKLANVPISKPHDLRHNSCTMCAKAGFNEMELRIRYGWSPTSKMPSRYTHLASKDLDDKIKSIMGFEEPEKPEDTVLQSIICWNCQEENVPTNSFCGKCGVQLDRKTEDLAKLKATDLGVAIQKGMNEEQVEKITKQVLVNLLKDYDVKKKEE